MSEPAYLPRVAALTHAMATNAAKADGEVLRAIEKTGQSRTAILKPVINALDRAIDAANDLQAYVEAHPELHP